MLLNDFRDSLEGPVNFLTADDERGAMSVECRQGEDELWGWLLCREGAPTSAYSKSPQKRLIFETQGRLLALFIVGVRGASGIR